MSLDVAPSTRLGARAAVAAALAMLAAHLLQLPRAYWAIFVAVVLAAETWSESVKRAAERLGMTALGCLAGALLHLAIAGSPRLEAGLLLAGVFFAAYFRAAAGRGSHAWMTFSITLYVVFLFAVLGRWSLHGIVLARLYDTAVGCAAAILASFVVRPASARRRLAGEIEELRRASRDLLAAAAGGESVDALRERGAALLERLPRLDAGQQGARYEALFSGSERHLVDARAAATEDLVHASVSLARALATARRPAPDRLTAALDALAAETLAAFDAPPGDDPPGDELCACLDDPAVEPRRLATACAAIRWAGDVRRALAALARAAPPEAAPRQAAPR